MDAFNLHFAIDLDFGGVYFHFSVPFFLLVSFGLFRYNLAFGVG